MKAILNECGSWSGDSGGSGVMRQVDFCFLFFSHLTSSTTMHSLLRLTRNDWGRIFSFHHEEKLKAKGCAEKFVIVCKMYKQLSGRNRKQNGK